MPYIVRRNLLCKCLKFKMPKMPKIMERAFSTINLILIRQDSLILGILGNLVHFRHFVNPNLGFISGDN